MPGTRDLIFMSLALLTALSGCSRKWYRDLTDKDVAATLTAKNVYPEWGIDQFHVYPHPDARFSDPSNPDRPPKPPDDPAAALLSPDPQPGKHVGVAYFENDAYLKYLVAWDVLNRAEVAAREKEKQEAEEREQAELEAKDGPLSPEKDGEKDPDPQPADDLEEREAAYAAVAGGGVTSLEKALASEVKPYLIKLEQTSELALFNSREFQNRREDLYFSALPVSLQRFGFAAQFFAAEEAVREVTGSQRPEGRRNLWRINSEAGFTKVFPRGALMLLRFANQLVIDLGRPSTAGREIGISTMNLEFIQPLLAGGGKAVNLEALTQAERDLLYAIRSYARFRKIFYAALAGGEGLGNPFGFFGLAGPGGVGPGAPTQGYLPTLLSGAFVRTAEVNVRVLEGILEQYQFFLEGGRVSQVQVGLIEGQLLDARFVLLQNQRNLRDTLDNFKIQLGLPTNLELELEDSPILPIDQQLERFDEVIVGYQEFRRTAGDLNTVDPAQLRALFIRLVDSATITRGTNFARTFRERLAEYSRGRLNDQQLDELIQRLTRTREELNLRRTRMLAEGIQPDQEIDDLQLQNARDLEMADFEQDLRRYEARPWLLRPEAEQADIRIRLFRSVRDALVNLASDAREEQLQRVRDAWPELPQVCVCDTDLLDADLDQAYAISARTALQNRFDLMNARGGLVDAWRQIAVQANSLLGVLDIRYDLESSTPQGLNQPLSFSGSRSRHRLIINGELPLVRRAERNAYRASLIVYQRQRRALQATEDLILRDVRQELRNLRVLAEQYRIQQRAVEVAYLNLESALEEFEKPLSPDERVDAAGQTQQLLNAQARVPQAQNSLYAIWINYTIARIRFYRDLEIMPLDTRGVWIDEQTCHDGAPENSTGNGRDPSGSPGGRGPGEGGDSEPLDPPRSFDDPSGRRPESLPGFGPLDDPEAPRD